MNKGNFLHEHPETQRVLGVDDNHVIVDRPDWEAILSLVDQNGLLLVSKLHEIQVDMLDISLRALNIDIQKDILEVVIGVVMLLQKDGPGTLIESVFVVGNQCKKRRDERRKEFQGNA